MLEDVQQLREEGFSLNNDFRISSPDTLARKMKALSVQSKKASSQHNTFKFNHNAKLNRLLLKTALQCGGISKSTSHTLDYDNTLIFTEKSDAKMTYKQSLGSCATYFGSPEGEQRLLRIHCGGREREQLHTCPYPSTGGEYQ
ncbi:hypothetical protein [Porphyromonas levii]|uniref:hypothetical protein n=2 Tax=Porphyromonas levii TaxID=28114 RepID=UPI001BA7C3D0|nr:hypothetical protein [Porphyromonas levii]